MWFLGAVLAFTTALLCYAGYVFLIVDKRAETAMIEDEDLFAALDDKSYDFELPEEIDTYEELRESAPADKRALPMALLKRAMADIPRIEQLEKDHPRMAKLFQKGLLPFGVWEQLVDAEAMMDTEVHTVQAEAEKLQKGWGQGVFSQAYQMLRKEREEEVQRQQMQKDQAKLTIEFTKPSGGVVTVTADGRKVTAQTPLAVCKESLAEEMTFKSEVKAKLVCGVGDDERTFGCSLPELVLDAEQDKQWKQIGQDAAGLRLQVKFVKKASTKVGGATFSIADVRATIPAAPSVIASSA